MATDTKTPVIRVAVGRDPNSVAAAGAPDYAFIQLGFQAVHNGIASAQKGRPVFDKALIVTHVYPGSTDQLDVEVKRYPSDGSEPLITDQARMVKFGDAIERFERSAADMEKGTPLSVLNFDPATIANMEGAGAKTVEMLAAVPDSSLNGLGMGARGFRQRAQAYLAQLDGGEEMAKLQGAYDQQAAELDEMRRQIRDLMDDRKPVPIGMTTARDGQGDGVGDKLPQSVSGASTEEKLASAAGAQANKPGSTAKK